MAVVNEVVTKFAFEGSLSPLTNFNATLGGSVKLLAGAGAAFVAASVALAGFVTSVSAAADPMIQLSRNTGVAVESIQALGFAATTNGSSVEAMESSISSLSAKIGEAAQKGSEDFARLGINVRGANGQVKDSAQVMDDLNKRFNQMNLSLGERQSFAEKLGIDKSLVQMLSLTTKEYGKLQARMAQRVITKKEADSLAKYNDQLQDNANLMTSLSRFLAVEFAPIFGDMAAGFTEMIEDNLPAIREGFKSFADGMKVAFSFIERMGLPILAALTTAFVVLKFAAIKTWLAALWPIVLIGGAIGVVLLAVEDLMAAFEGGQSLIQDWFKEFFNVDIGAGLREIVAVAGEVVDGFISIFKWGIDTVAGIFDGVDILAPIGAAFSVVGNLFGALISLMTGDFTGFIDGITAAFQSFIDFFKIGFENISNLADNLTPDIPSLDEIGGGISDFLGFGGGDTATDNRKIEQNVTMNITASDTAEAAGAFGGSLNSQLEDAQRQFSGGGI